MVLLLTDCTTPATLTILNQSANVNFNGQVKEAASIDLSSSSAKTFTLSGTANDTTGSLTVRSGTLAIAAAAKFPIAKAEKWEIDFVMVPSYQTREKRSRFLYVLAAVDAATGERRVWEKMSVDGRPGGLKRLWEAHAQRVLDRVLVLGRIPGEIHVRTGRVMRFLRPLGLQLPFKLVQHAKLPALDAVLELAVRSGTV